MQPTATVTRTDIERIVRRDFPAEKYAEIMVVLDEYGAASCHLERDRVQAAVLKLAAGRQDSLRSHIELAKSDWREVLAPAEYPEYTRHWFRIKEYSSEERQRIIAKDWDQYRKWFER